MEGEEPAPQPTPFTQLLTTATPSTQLLAPRGRVRGNHTKAGLGGCTGLCPRAVETQLGTSHIPYWAFSQNRGCQEGLQASPAGRSSITCSIRVLLTSSSPKPSWAAATLHGLGHVPALHLPTWGKKKKAKRPQTGKNRDIRDKGKGCSKKLSSFLPFGRRTAFPIPPMPYSQPPTSTQL